MLQFIDGKLFQAASGTVGKFVADCANSIRKLGKPLMAKSLVVKLKAWTE
jgi:hypothetical protein